MTRIRNPYSIITGALLAIAFAACVTTQPLTAQSVKQVVVTLSAPSVALGGRTTATARVRLANGAYATNKPVAWGTSKPGIALVSDKGVVSSVALGSATIVATVGGVAGQAVIAVTAPNPPPPPPAVVASVSVTLVAPALAIGATTQAAAIARDSSGDVVTNRAVTWASLAPSIATVSSSGLVTAASAGTAAIRATVDAKTATMTVTVAAPVDTSHAAPDTSTTITLPTLLTTSVANSPSTGRTLSVSATGNLQAAFDTASQGDKISLTCGAIYAGNFILRPKSGSGWITVGTTCALPPENTRTDTTQRFATITSPNVLPAIATNGAAHNWRFIGPEVTTSAATSQGLIALGCASLCESDTASMPRDIIFDRAYIHGTPSVDLHRCIGLHGARLAVIDSYVSECHSAFDAQAIASWNGPGPFKIVNNYLAGAAETIAFGGANLSITGLIPSDIEIRGNHITKPMSWKGGPWLVKNAIEIKNGQRILIDGNVIENTWPQAQDGYAVVLWSANSGCSWCTTRDVTVRNNVLRNVAAGFQLTARYDGTTIPMRNVWIVNNVMIGVANPAIGGIGKLFAISDSIASLTIEHNTGFSPNSSSFLWGGALPLPNHVVRNNLVGGGQYQLFSTFGQGQTAWDAAAGAGSIFSGNVVAEFAGGNMIPGNFSAQFSDLGIATPYSVTVDPSALAIGVSSFFHDKGTNGSTPGANIATITTAIAGVVQAPPSAQRIRTTKP